MLTVLSVAGAKDKCIIGHKSLATNPLSHRSGGASPRKSFKVLQFQLLSLLRVVSFRIYDNDSMTGLYCVLQILPTKSDANVSKVVPLSLSEQNPANSIFCPELSMFDAGHGDGGKQTMQTTIHLKYKNTHHNI